MKTKPTQEEVLEWLRINHPELESHSVIERDWIWIRGGRGSSLFTGIADSLKSFGFRAKKTGSHELSDGTDAVWYHSCQGAWRPGGKWKRRGGAKKPRKPEELSKSAALKLANLL